jgi:hypothetical protein
VPGREHDRVIYEINSGLLTIRPLKYWHKQALNNQVSERAHIGEVDVRTAGDIQTGKLVFNAIQGFQPCIAGKAQFNQAVIVTVKDFQGRAPGHTR